MQADPFVDCKWSRRKPSRYPPAACSQFSTSLWHDWWLWGWPAAKETSNKLDVTGQGQDLSEAPGQLAMAYDTVDINIPGGRQPRLQNTEHELYLPSGKSSGLKGHITWYLSPRSMWMNRPLGLISSPKARISIISIFRLNSESIVQHIWAPLQTVACGYNGNKIISARNAVSCLTLLVKAYSIERNKKDGKVWKATQLPRRQRPLEVGSFWFLGELACLSLTS